MGNGSNCHCYLINLPVSSSCVCRATVEDRAKETMDLSAAFSHRHYERLFTDAIKQFVPEKMRYQSGEKRRSVRFHERELGRESGQRDEDLDTAAAAIRETIRQTSSAAHGDGKF